MTGKFKRCTKLLGLLATGALATISQPVWSAAFQLNEQNASGLGVAYAGSAAIAEDASTGFYNPAGLSRLGEQVVGSGVLVRSHTKLNINRADVTAPALGGPLSGNVSNRNYSFVPAFHYTNKIDENWAFGISVASPFGLKNNYFPMDSVVRYFATRSELKTFDIGPNLAYDFQNGLSLGAGVDAVYIHTKLDLALGTGIPATDGYIKTSMTDWGYGYHLGALYQLSEQTRFGLHYRSKVRLRPKGDLETLVPDALTPRLIGSIFAQRKVETALDLPETAVLSVYHAFDEQWAMMADFQWTHWKRFKDLTLTLDRIVATGSLGEVTIPQRFRNSYRVALGASYQYDCNWRFRVGTAFDKTPTRDEFRTVNIPDQNRIWAAVGAQYRITERLALDAGYAHLFFKKANLNETFRNFLDFDQSLQGTAKGRADLIGIQLTWDLV